MNCSVFEPLIALYVEDDLSESERIHVETHLEGCPVCRGLADELRESQALFKGLRLGAVNSTVLAEVRQRVLDEVGDLHPVPGWVLTVHRLIFAGLRRRTAIAGVVLAAVISGGVWYEYPRAIVEDPGAPPQVARMLSAVEVLSQVPKRSTASSRTVRRVVPREAVFVVPVEESLLQSIDEPRPPEYQVSQIPMKFLTDDPDIIIYWLPTDKGD